LEVKVTTVLGIWPVDIILLSSNEYGTASSAKQKTLKYSDDKFCTILVSNTYVESTIL